MTSITTNVKHRVRTTGLEHQTLTKTLDLLIFFHQVCKNTCATHSDANWAVCNCACAVGKILHCVLIGACHRVYFGRMKN